MRASEVFSFLVCSAVLVLALGGCPDRTSGEEESTGTRVMRAEEDPCTVAEPCPEAAAAVDPIPPDDPRLEGALFIDARPEESFEEWHHPSARNVVYDILDPTPREIVIELASLDVPLIVVYGDGDIPDSGEELARDLAGQGVENVYFIEGGAERLEASEAVAGRD